LATLPAVVPRDAIQAAVAMAADYDEIGVKFLAGAEDAAPGLSLLNDRWLDSEIGTTRGKCGEMLDGLLDKGSR